MKKVLAIMLLFVLTLTGCSDVTEPMPTASADPEIKEEALFRYADLIPDPEEMFQDIAIDIQDQDGGKAYIFTVNNATEDYFVEYIRECKERNFAEVSYETGESFGAYSIGGEYWVEVHYTDDDQSMMVVCQKSKNYEPKEES